jgi:spore photoproduct lyase
MIEKIYVQKNLTDNVFVKNFFNRYKSNVRPEFFSDFSKLINKLNINFDYESGKKILVFKENKNKFIKKCPCTSNVLSCRYYIMNIIQNCYLGCTYCYLQQYVNNNLILINCNLENIDEEFEELSRKFSGNVRLGSGEYSDSLIFDEYTGITEYLINKVNKYKNIYFEVKSKTDNIYHLKNLKLNNPSNLVFSWSMNPAKIIKSEELFAANLDKRLKAAKEIQENGFSLAFHFDPIIVTDNWEEEYFSVLEKIFSLIESDKVLWMSLGIFRCNPELMPIIRKKYPESKTYTMEHIIGKDNKVRCIRPIRKNIFKKMVNKIRTLSKKTVIYLCMEDKKMWEYSKCDSPEKIINFNTDLNK